MYVVQERLDCVAAGQAVRQTVSTADAEIRAAFVGNFLGASSVGRKHLVVRGNHQERTGCSARVGVLLQQPDPALDIGWRAKIVIPDEQIEIESRVTEQEAPIAECSYILLVAKDFSTR